MHIKVLPVVSSAVRRISYLSMAAVFCFCLGICTGCAKEEPADKEEVTGAALTGKILKPGFNDLDKNVKPKKR
jgi:hypothetical protein